MRFSCVRRFLGLLCAAVMVFSCVTVSMAETKKVTVMVYMCGSNLESRNMEGTKALGQMIRSKFRKEDVNVVVMAGGSVSWNNGFDPEHLTIGELGNGRKIKTEEYPLAAMGETGTLSWFLSECAARYPAQTNILVFWDHGGGPAYGVCQDELFQGDTLSLPEMTAALENSPYADHGLDLIAFNACLMGSAELSVVLAPYARYLVATEDSMYGLTYDWLSGVESRSVQETAQIIVDDSYEYNREIVERQHASEINSFSVVDLAKASALSDAADAFFARVAQELSDTSFTGLSAARRASVAFGAGESGSASGFDLVDLGDLAAHYRDCAPAEADALLQAVQEAVVYHRGDMPECTGLTVYHPFENKREDLLVQRVSAWNDLGFAPGYAAYLQTFTALLTGTRLADWSGLRASASARKDQRTLYTMTLTEEQAAHFGAASLTALVNGPDDAYQFVWAGDSSAPEGQTLSAEYVHTALCITDSGGKSVFRPLAYTRDQKGNYLIPAVLIRHEKETEDGLLPAVTQQALISCAYEPETRKLLPGGVRILDEETGGYTPAFRTVFTDYDEILLSVSSRRETRDEAGILLPFDQWELSGTEEYRCNIDGTWFFSLLPDDTDTGNLSVAFRVTDSQNNQYFSELLPVQSMPQAADAVTEYDDANLVKIESLSVIAGNGYLRLSMELTNLTDTESVIVLEHLTLNGEACGFGAEAYGNGADWGLLPGESSPLVCAIPLESWDGPELLTDIAFDLTLQHAADPGTISGTVPVQVRTSVDLAAGR